MKKRITKEQREENEIAELHKQLCAIYTTATTDDWMNDSDNTAFLTPESLHRVMWAIRSSFGLEADHGLLRHYNVELFERPSILAKSMHDRGFRAWTPFVKETT